MEINRNTYETFFLLYIDNELTMEERAQVEAFIVSNPDLGMELQMLQETILNPDQSLVFGNKQDLLKSATNPVNELNYEEYFVQYLDDELTLEQKEHTEQFVYANPQYQHEFELILSIKLRPDTNQVFENKEVLYRTEKDEKVFVMRWWKIAAAAAVIFAVAGTGWYYSGPDIENHQTMAQVPSSSSLPEKTSDTNNSIIVPETNSGNQPMIENSNERREQASTGKAESAQAENKLATRSVNPEKIISKPGNISTDVNVEQSNNGGMAINTNKIPGADEAINTSSEELLKPEPVLALVSTSGENSDQNEFAENTPLVTDPEQDINSNVIYIANTSISKKNKLRGILRTASRVFEKTASLQPSGNKKGIRIANFEIGLQ